MKREALELVRVLELVQAMEMVWYMLLIAVCSEEVTGCCSWVVMGAEIWHVGRLGR